jgi:hypothetical protein
MHRVELKVRYYGQAFKSYKFVPNAPCGVESHCQIARQSLHPSFLMHRVELKDKALRFLNFESQKHPLISREVPNAPCGVESSFWKGWNV